MTSSDRMDDFRLKAWMDGELRDDELAAWELEWLEHAVFAAVSRKTGAAPQPDWIQ